MGRSFSAPSFLSCECSVKGLTLLRWKTYPLVLSVYMAGFYIRHIAIIEHILLTGVVWSFSWVDIRVGLSILLFTDIYAGFNCCVSHKTVCACSWPNMGISCAVVFSRPATRQSVCQYGGSLTEMSFYLLFIYCFFEKAIALWLSTIINPETWWMSLGEQICLGLCLWSNRPYHDDGL